MWLGFLFVAGIIGLYILSYSLNKKTPAPIDLKNIDAVKCGACNNFACTIKQHYEEEK
ncbi:MAG: hypothetical protein ACLFRI_01780 [Candidatus Izemoplasmataceae bacterium]